MKKSVSGKKVKFYHLQNVQNIFEGRVTKNMSPKLDATAFVITTVVITTFLITTLVIILMVGDISHNLGKGDVSHKRLLT